MSRESLTLGATQPYLRDVAPRHKHPSQRTVEDAIERALTDLLPGELGDQPHLVRALLADRLAQAATRTSRAEVMAARDRDGATWDDVAETFGVSRQAAHERFRTGPDGLHSRYFKRPRPS